MNNIKKFSMPKWMIPYIPLLCDNFPFTKADIERIVNNIPTKKNDTMGMWVHISITARVTQLEVMYELRYLKSGFTSNLHQRPVKQYDATTK